MCSNGHIPCARLLQFSKWAVPLITYGCKTIAVSLACKSQLSTVHHTARYSTVCANWFEVWVASRAVRTGPSMFVFMLCIQCALVLCNEWSETQTASNCTGSGR